MLLLTDAAPIFTRTGAAAAASAANGEQNSNIKIGIHRSFVIQHQPGISSRRIIFDKRGQIQDISDLRQERNGSI
jgi:hypothetical protein